MRHEISHSHIARQNEGDRAREQPQDGQNAARELDHALQPEQL